jgi:hypothetical protein
MVMTEERLRLKNYLQKVVDKVSFYPTESVYIKHDPEQTLFVVYSITIAQDGSIRYLLRSGDRAIEALEQELSYEINKHFLLE